MGTLYRKHGEPGLASDMVDVAHDSRPQDKSQPRRTAVGSPNASTVFQPRGEGTDQGGRTLEDRCNHRSQREPTKSSLKKGANELNWALKMSQKAKSRGEKHWAKLQLAKAQEKIATGWMGQLQARARAAKAAKAEWEKREGPAEQQWRQVQQLQSEIAEINDINTQRQEAAKEQIRRAEEDAQQQQHISLQRIQALEEKLAQLRQAAEAQADGRGEQPTSTIATTRQSQHPNKNPKKPTAHDLHTGRALAAQMRLDKTQQQRDAAIEGMRWGTHAYWRDRIRECFLRAKAEKFAADTQRLRTALQELQARHEQSEAEVWQLQSDLDAEIDEKLHWQEEYEKAKNKSKKKKVPPAKEKPTASDTKTDPFGAAAYREAQPKDGQTSSIQDGYTTLQAQIKALSQKYD